MAKLVCPMCKQGWVVAARVSATNAPVWVCDECESLWHGTAPPEGAAYDNLGTYLESLGLEPLWIELDVVRDDGDGS